MLLSEHQTGHKKVQRLNVFDHNSVIDHNCVMDYASALIYRFFTILLPKYFHLFMYIIFLCILQSYRHINHK